MAIYCVALGNLLLSKVMDRRYQGGTAATLERKKRIRTKQLKIFLYCFLSYLPAVLFSFWQNKLAPDNKFFLSLAMILLHVVHSALLLGMSDLTRCNTPLLRKLFVGGERWNIAGGRVADSTIHAAGTPAYQDGLPKRDGYTGSVALNTIVGSIAANRQEGLTESERDVLF